VRHSSRTAIETLRYSLAQPSLGVAAVPRAFGGADFASADSAVKGGQILLFIMVAPNFFAARVSFRRVVFDRPHRVTVFDALAKIECHQVAPV
jgi:hypothetical protein